MSDPVKAPPKVQIGVPDVLGNDFARSVWCVTPPNGSRPEDLVDPRAFTPSSHFFKPGDIIEAMPADGSWWAQLIVRNAERGAVKTGLIHAVDFEDAAIPTESVGGDLEIRWRGPKLRFGVVRKSDNQILRENLTTRLDAHAWAVEHQRSFGG